MRRLQNTSGTVRGAIGQIGGEVQLDKGRGCGWNPLMDDEKSVNSSSGSSEVTDGWKHVKGKCIFFLGICYYSWDTG